MSTPNIPKDHDERMIRTKLSLDGLSVGDAFGRSFFGKPEEMDRHIKSRTIPPTSWQYTDDTEMALGIVDVLERLGVTQQDELAMVFARRYRKNPNRAYGHTAHDILTAIGEGVHWSSASSSPYGGLGSMGNGGAMRVAPLGAYFCDDISRLVDEARKSAMVTHAHVEGQAGAIAVALAAAYARNNRASEQSGEKLIEFVLNHMPTGETRAGVEKAFGTSRKLSVDAAVGILGNGSRIISQDTVPFCLWCAARHLDNFVDAMWTTVSGLGDRDTTCAIVGGIVALSAGERSIPSEWLCAREPLK